MAADYPRRCDVFTGIILVLHVPIIHRNDINQGNEFMGTGDYNTYNSWLRVMELKPKFENQGFHFENFFPL